MGDDPTGSVDQEGACVGSKVRATQKGGDARRFKRRRDHPVEIAVSVEDGHPEREDRALNDRRDADTNRRLVRATDFLEDNVADPRGASAVVGAGDRIAIGGHGPEADDVRVRGFTALEQRVLVVGAEREEPGHRGDQLHRRVMQADVVGNILGERLGHGLLAAQLCGDVLGLLPVGKH